MSKVTYLLGAGASYGSREVLPLPLQPSMSTDNAKPLKGIERGLPVLQEFSLAIEQLHGELENIYSSDKFIAEKKYIQSEILSPLLRISKEFPTIDTYAKMLYATKQGLKYIKFKSQLSVFFMIWQKIHKNDLRYDSFIASLLDAETCALPPLTIFSWNYDMQFEMAYSKYIIENPALWKIWDQLNVYCKTNTTLPKTNISLPFSFVKLNGSALFHSSERDRQSLRFELQDTLWCTYSEKDFLREIYELYINSQYKHELDSPKYQNELAYCWDNSGKNEIQDYISKRVSNCETFVIIGYSLPYVNREIDRHIFSSMPNLKTIYIQDVDATNIAERVSAIYQYLQKDAPRIILKTDVGQFFIPNELG